MSCRSRGVLPKSPTPRFDPDDNDTVYNAINAVSTFATRSRYDPTPRRHHRLLPIVAQTPRSPSPPRHRPASLIDFVLHGDRRRSFRETSDADEEDPRSFHFVQQLPRRKSALHHTTRTGDNIARRVDKPSPFERPSFLEGLRRFLGERGDGNDSVDDASSGARSPTTPASSVGSTLHRKHSVRLESPDMSSLRRKHGRADVIAATLDAVFPVGEDPLTAEARMLVREAMELRELEERERLQRLVRLDEQVTSLRDKMRFEDYVVLRRQFNRFAVEGSLRLNRIPKGGWVFCGQVITGVVARKLDRDHSGALDFFEVLRYLYPAMSYQDVQRSIAAFEKRFRDENKERQALTLQRMAPEPLNDFARSFLSHFSATERADPDVPKRLTIDRFRAMVSVDDELVPSHDFDNLFAKHAKVRDGVAFLDFECFVAALYTFPRVWGE